MRNAGDHLFRQSKEIRKCHFTRYDEDVLGYWFILPRGGDDKPLSVELPKGQDVPVTVGGMRSLVEAGNKPWEILDSTVQAGQIPDKTSGSLELVNSETENIPTLPIWNLQVPNYSDFPMDAFLHIGFTHHGLFLPHSKH